MRVCSVSFENFAAVVVDKRWDKNMSSGVVFAGFVPLFPSFVVVLSVFLG